MKKKLVSLIVSAALLTALIPAAFAETGALSQSEKNIWPGSPQRRFPS